MNADWAAGTNNRPASRWKLQIASTMRTLAKPHCNNATRFTVTIICLLISPVESAVTRTNVPSKIAGPFRSVISVASRSRSLTVTSYEREQKFGGMERSVCCRLPRKRCTDGRLLLVLLRYRSEIYLRRKKIHLSIVERSSLKKIENMMINNVRSELTIRSCFQKE